jgi:hypothetical protein
VRFIKLSLLAVLVTALLATPAPAKGPYKVNVHIQMSGGLKGPIHVNDPIMISLRARGHGSERYDPCMTPGPSFHDPCYKNRRVNGPGVSTEPSKAGRLRLRFKLSTGRLLVRDLRIRK